MIPVERLAVSDGVMLMVLRPGCSAWQDHRCALTMLQPRQLKLRDLLHHTGTSSAYPGEQAQGDESPHCTFVHLLPPRTDISTICAENVVLMMHVPPAVLVEQRSACMQCRSLLEG